MYIYVYGYIYLLCAILYKTPMKSIYMGLAYYKHDYFLIWFFQEKKIDWLSRNNK